MEHEYYDNSRTKWIILGGILAALLVGIFLFSALYRVEAVEVIGSSRYSEEEIKDMVLHGVAAQNTILASRFLSRENILDVPFVDSIRVTTLDRNTLAISVREKKAVGCFPYLDSYIYFDRNGVFIEGERIRDMTVPFFSGISVKNVVQNQKLDLKGQNVLNTAVVLATIFQKNNQMPDDIQFDENYQVRLIYGDIVVELGKEELLEDKITRVMAILPKLEGRAGTLHAQTVNENTKSITFEISVTPENWTGGYEASGEYTGEGEFDKYGNYTGPRPKTEEEKAALKAAAKAAESGSAQTDDSSSGTSEGSGTLKVNSTSIKIDLDYLDADGDGINDYTGDEITEDSMKDLSYLDEDGDGINDFTGESLTGESSEEKTEDSETKENGGEVGEAQEEEYQEESEEYSEESYEEEYYEGEEDW